jgi:hypothetical protein
MLFIGCLLALFIGFVHSALGERYILTRLFRRSDLPKLLGSDWFTKRVLRFAWHLTTLAWWGFAAILYALSRPNDNIVDEILLIIAVVFLLSGIMSGVFTRGKHFSWVIFFAISAICWHATSFA